MSQINEFTLENEVAPVNENVAETHVVQEEGGAEGGVLASLGLNGTLFAFQLFNFLLVIGIVWFLILKPLTKQMDQRKKIIDESLDKAKEIESNMTLSEQKFKEKIDEAKAESNQIIQHAHEEAEETAEKMKLKAKEEIENLVEQAKRNIENEKKEMRVELRQETVELVLLTVEKLLGEKMDSKKDKSFIEDILNEKK